MDPFAPIATQRRALADVLAGLTAEQWEVRSLCDAWTVHQLAGHMVVPFQVGIPRVVLEMGKALGNFSKANVALAMRAAEAPPEEIVAALRANADSHFTPPGHDWHVPLADTYVHTQDICIPLGIEAPADPAQWPVILDFLMSKKARGVFVGRPLPAVRFSATDVGWSAAKGPRRAARRRRSSPRSWGAPPSPTSSRAPARRRWRHGRLARRGWPAPRLRRSRPHAGELTRDRDRPPLRPLLRGLRGRRRLPALARQDHHRGRRPPVLHDHDEPPPDCTPTTGSPRTRPPHGQERGGGQPRVLAGARA